MRKGTCARFVALFAGAAILQLAATNHSAAGPAAVSKGTQNPAPVHIAMAVPRLPHPMLNTPALAGLAEPRLTLAAAGGMGRLNRRLVRLLRQVERRFGRPVLISSGCRSRSHNRRIGGAPASWHLRCMAADFKVAGVSKSALLRYVRSMPGRGGIGTYCRTAAVHLDVGPPRQWHQGCRRKRR